jgi:hypothetical protein
MPVTHETLKKDLENLSNEQLQKVSDFIAFLKFEDKRHRRLLDFEKLAALASDFAEEDLALAEVGMDDYAIMLTAEDL